MSDTPNPVSPDVSPPLAQAVLKPAARQFLGWYWVLPGFVLLIVCIVLLLSWSQRGERIIVTFKEGHGLKAGDVLRTRGITVGEVRLVELASDRKSVRVTIDLRPSASGIAVDGSHFWIVRPRAALTGLSGLETVVGAKYVEVSPGDGKPKREFDGDDEPLVAEMFEPNSLKIVLQGKRLGGLRRGVPLLYRQARIGSVGDVRLAGDGVEADVHVQSAHKDLVRDNSEFWIVSGFKVEGSVVSGLTLAAESAETLLAGGVAMILFGKPGEPVKSGHPFPLADEAPKERGERILIHFNEGHGLKTGDYLRHRGISLGEVRSVTLSGGLQGVNVEVDLRPNVTGIAVDGSRFWIVRPQADLTGLSGLDTLVGARYIAVVPGDGGPKDKFDGDETPVVEPEPGGLRFVVKDSRTGGLRPGAPLSFRGIPIGTVLKSDLASDASGVEIHIHVLPRYKNLVRKNSEFWNVSGLKAKAVPPSVAFESLATVLAGGMAMATPDPPGEAVLDGYRFPTELAESEPDKWQTWKPPIPLVDTRLPQGATPPHLVRAMLKYHRKGFGGFGTQAEARQGLLLPVGGNWFLGPDDLLTVPEKAIPTLAVELVFEGIAQPITASHSSVSLRALKSTSPVPGKSLSRSELRGPEGGKENCLLVTDSFAESLFIAADNRLTETKQGWVIESALAGQLGSEKWHGAAAVSVKDGKVIGLLHSPKKGARLILPLTPQLLEQLPKP